MSRFGIAQENLNVWICDTSRELKCQDLGYFRRTETSGFMILQEMWTVPT